MTFFKRSIRSRLLITFTTVTIIGSLALFGIAGRQLETSTLEFYKRDLLTEAMTIAGSLAQQQEEEEHVITTRALQGTFGQFQGRAEQQLVLVDSQLRVIAATMTNGKMPPQSLPVSPELARALDGQPAQDVRPDDDGTLMVYSAAPIRFEEGVYAILIVGVPLQPAYEQARAGWLQLSGAVLPVILLNIIASLWLGEVLSRPIRALYASALRITGGALNERIEVRQQDEIGQLGQAFNDMVISLNALITAQRSFVNNAAHELRAPLMSLKLRLEALGSPALSEDERERYAREANEEVEHMAGLVSALLLLARIDEGRHGSQAAPFDGVALLHDAIRSWRIQARKASLVLRAEIPDHLPDLPLKAADLRIIVDNLIGNAVKYTPRSGEISFCANSNGQSFYLEVSDTGEGFTPEDGTRLFERFFRADRSHNQQIPGTGLGLSIVQALVTQYGGSVTASSPGPGLGARFIVSIPLST
jgi:two-component system, OmpR family, sensor histidine kinase BaeS